MVEPSVAFPYCFCKVYKALYLSTSAGFVGSLLTPSLRERYSPVENKVTCLLLIVTIILLSLDFGVLLGVGLLKGILLPFISPFSPTGLAVNQPPTV